MTIAPPRSVARVTTPRDWPGDARTDRKRIPVMFGEYALTDPFISMAEDWFSEVGFDWHPHRGFETVSLVLDGGVEHRDTTGAGGLLTPGDVQWMTAGGGILHSELAHERRGTHMLQLWVNLPSTLKMHDPVYRDLRAASAAGIEADGVGGRLYAGDLLGAAADADLLHDARLAHLTLERGARVSLDVPAAQRAFVYLLDGAARLGREAAAVSGPAVAWFDPGAGAVELHADTRTQLVVAAGTPIGEPIAQYGPFVMTTDEELRHAVLDYRAGRFGRVPA